MHANDVSRHAEPQIARPDTHRTYCDRFSVDTDTVWVYVITQPISACRTGDCNLAGWQTVFTDKDKSFYKTGELK